MRILGVDPGTQVMGYGVVEEEAGEASHVASGSLKAPRGLPLGERLYSLYTQLLEVLDKHRPQEVAVEQPFVASNPRSAIAVGQAMAVALLAAASRGLPCFSYTPTQVKMALTNFGRGDKEQVRRMVGLHLKLPTPPPPYDATDAIALALCHLGRRYLTSLERR